MLMKLGDAQPRHQFILMNAKSAPRWEPPKQSANWLLRELSGEDRKATGNVEV